MIETAALLDTMTADQFYDYCGGKDGRLELVNGKVVEMPPVATRHGRLDYRFARLWADYVIENGLGDVFMNTGFILFREPDQVRGPDQAFVSKARMDACPAPERGFWPIAPDLVVEIVSPDDAASELRAKVQEYLEAGVRIVWMIYPTREQIHVHHKGRRVEVVEKHGELSGEEVIPGLVIPLEAFWGA